MSLPPSEPFEQALSQPDAGCSSLGSSAGSTWAGLPDHRDRLLRAPCDLCGSHEEAKDLVQETYVGVLRHGRPCVLASRVPASAVVALAAAPLLTNGHR